MKVQRSSRARSVVLTGVVALVLAVPTYALACYVSGPPPPPVLVSTTSFSITSTISSSSTSQVPALLYPGVQRYLWYDVANPLTVPLTVTSLSISAVTTPSGCALSNLDYANTTFTGSLLVPQKVGAVDGTNAVAVPISLYNFNFSQNNPASTTENCADKTFTFTFKGTAQYTDTTTTVLTSSPDPSSSGQSVTFTANVTATDATSDPSQPTGTVDFYKCASATSCTPSPSTLLGTGTLGSNGEATFSTSFSATTYVEAVYEGQTTTFVGSTSNIVTQTVTSAAATTTVLTSSPNPSLLGQSVMLTATVVKSSGSGTPTGTVDFYLGTPTGTHTLLGTGTLNSSGKATLSTTTLPAGTDTLYAVYVGNASFASSTSPTIIETVVSPPKRCEPRNFDHYFYFFGPPGFPNFTGPGDNDFIYAFGQNYVISDGGGDHCICVGDQDNFINDGNGNDNDSGGNGTNQITVGNGSDTVTVGDGNSNKIIAGSGTDTVTVGNGSHNSVAVGNGNDTVSIGTGSYNTVTLGSGTDTVTIAGSNDTITGGAGNETIYLGSGTYNTYNGQAHHTNTCHLPAPPASYHGTTAAYYHDTITNCTVVSP
jgi:hypothetical protein